MKKLLLPLVFALLPALNIFGQITKPVEFEQLKRYQEKDKKLVMVFLETDWCKFCKAMKQSLLNNKQVADKLKNDFYTVILNAEEKRKIQFNDRVFKFKPTGVNTGIHNLAEELGTINGQNFYPAICILNENNEIIYQYHGYLDPKSMIKMLDIISKANP